MHNENTSFIISLLLTILARSSIRDRQYVISRVKRTGANHKWTVEEKLVNNHSEETSISKVEDDLICHIDDDT